MPMYDRSGMKPDPLQAKIQAKMRRGMAEAERMTKMMEQRQKEHQRRLERARRRRIRMLLRKKKRKKRSLFYHHLLFYRRSRVKSELASAHTFPSILGWFKNEFKNYVKPHRTTKELYGDEALAKERSFPRYAISRRFKMVYEGWGAKYYKAIEAYDLLMWRLASHVEKFLSLRVLKTKLFGLFLSVYYELLGIVGEFPYVSYVEWFKDFVIDTAVWIWGIPIYFYFLPIPLYYLWARILILWKHKEETLHNRDYLANNFYLTFRFDRKAHLKKLRSKPNAPVLRVRSAKGKGNSTPPSSLWKKFFITA